jgi:manganese transport protein
MSNLMAVLLQTLSARMGIVTGHDLCQGCRREYPRIVTLALWVLAGIAIAATDLAEALGTIVGPNLLFRLPLLWGCAVTASALFCSSPFSAMACARWRPSSSPWSRPSAGAS